MSSWKLRSHTSFRAMYVSRAQPQPPATPPRPLPHLHEVHLNAYTKTPRMNRTPACRRRHHMYVVEVKTCPSRCLRHVLLRPASHAVPLSARAVVAWDRSGRQQRATWRGILPACIPPRREREGLRARPHLKPTPPCTLPQAATSCHTTARHASIRPRVHDPLGGLPSHASHGFCARAREV